MRRPAKKLRELLGVNVRRLRQEKRLTQEELCARAGMGQSYLSQLESGAKSVSIDVLDKLARALGVTPDQLLRK
ncbi:helix-turn-helix transcriptional regulator [Sinimarinibacterium sp. CAU 1509]|uniref:helix-turn-helix domain-containing protein n=1 Tax=Sinimarinibacterium sp. CAU 1509 TaxID=2562283 RepID=UPI0010AC2AC4|nr:helix-turn-helix transcriptional regulator [Sinimarinibacterium sp. CAU 1509]TJY56199.1 helix-turn-helix transcriptional regulator [Sinimarinibacterium sp. CAU 1509]